jgi:hypothetical protein
MKLLKMKPNKRWAFCYEGKYCECKRRLRKEYNREAVAKME